MALQPYADRPARAGLQMLADLAVLTWAAGWIWAAVQLHAAVTGVGSAGFRLRDGAAAVSARLGDAGDAVRRVPLAGDRLAAPLRSAGGAAADVAGAGQQFGDGVTGLATPLAIALVLGATLPLVAPWLALRWRYARRAGAAAALAGSPAGDRLLALRALTGQPPRQLVAVDPDPAGAWRRDDAAVTAALADLELRRLGLRSAAARRPASSAAARPEPSPPP